MYMYVNKWAQVEIKGQLSFCRTHGNYRIYANNTSYIPNSVYEHAISDVPAQQQCTAQEKISEERKNRQPAEISNGTESKSKDGRALRRRNNDELRDRVSTNIPTIVCAYKNQTTE